MRLVRDGLITLLCRVLSMVGALGLSVVTARCLGPQGRGVFALPTINAAIATAMFVGLSTAMSYLLLQQAGRGAIRAVLLAAIPFVAVGSVMVVALGLVGNHGWATVFAVASLPFAAMTSIAQGVCYGTHRVRLANYIGLSLTLVSLLGTIAGFVLIERTPRIAIAAWLLSQVLVAVAGIAIITRIGRELAPSASPARNALHFATKIGAVNLVTLLNYRADVYIVALFTPPSVLGMYTLAVAGAEATQLATQAIATSTAPHIGSLPPDRSRALTARAARNTVAIAALACIAIASVAPRMVPALFGSAFQPVVGVLRILLVGIVALSVSGILSNYFTLALGKPERSLAIAGAGALTSVVLGLILVPRTGITGAAISVAASYICSATLYVLLFARAAEMPLRDILVLDTTDLYAYANLTLRTFAKLRRIVALSERPT